MQPVLRPWAFVLRPSLVRCPLSWMPFITRTRDHGPQDGRGTKNQAPRTGVRRGFESALLRIQQLDVEQQRRVRRNDSGARSAIRVRWRDDKPAQSADFHARDSLIPSLITSPVPRVKANGVLPIDES